MIYRYSMIQDFLTCPKHFYDRYILNKIETERSSALEFGTALHLGIRETLNANDGLMAFNMYWNSLKDVHMQYYQYSWKGLQELANDSFLPNFKSRHAKKFIDHKQEQHMIGKIGDSTIQGTADCISQYEGMYTLTDWKTSSKSYPKNKIELNLQLYIYSELLRQVQGLAPSQIMYKVFNKKDGSINTIKKSLTPADLSARVTIVNHVIRNMNFVIENKTLSHGADCFCEVL